MAPRLRGERDRAVRHDAGVRAARALAGRRRLDRQRHDGLGAKPAPRRRGVLGVEGGARDALQGRGARARLARGSVLATRMTVRVVVTTPLEDDLLDRIRAADERIELVVPRELIAAPA